MPVLPKISLNSQFHILRHFTTIDEDFRKELKTKTGFSDKEIEDELALSGSKFFPDFVKNPQQLWDKILNHPTFFVPGTNDWKQERFAIVLLFDQNEYPNGIATDSLVRLDQLLPEERIHLQKKERGEYLVNQVRLSRNYPTRQINVIFGKDTQPFIKTVFPGIYAPPFPDADRQSDSDFTENESFWEHHAFIESP
jgi:hypothetical protein